MTDAPARPGRGYADERYAASLAEFGVPVPLRRSGGWLLQRAITGTPNHDLMGPYPVFSCIDWRGLPDDLADLDDSFVSVTAVVDPLGCTDPAQLRAAFPDRVVPFKRHLVRDLSATAPLPPHHRRRLRQATQAVDVEISVDPVQWTQDWVQLYAPLAARHALVGIRAFSPDSFRAQLGVPGMVALRATRADATVSMALWLVAGTNAYYHLGASSPAGYEVSASYAVFAAALEHLRARDVRQVDLGAAPGSEAREEGLFRFKRGWATGDRPAFLCGRIVDRRRYVELSAGPPTSWFPAYRAADPDLGARPSTSAGVI